MKAILSAIVAVAVIAVASYAVLDSRFQAPAGAAYATTGARVTPGH